MIYVAHFIGPSALSEFRRAHLLLAIGTDLTGLAAIDSHHVYLAEFDAPPHRAALALMATLLEARLAEAAQVHAGGVLIVPRPGTISPWSSKATDILRNVGLDGVLRVERATRWRFHDAAGEPLERGALEAHAGALYDRMTHVMVPAGADADAAAASIFSHPPPRPLTRIGVAASGRPALARANLELGLALSGEEIDYLGDQYRQLGRDPTDVELMMFAQANSEHCRHKIFNAGWTVDGVAADRSLFDAIRNTHRCSPGAVLSAYSDNAAIVAGPAAAWFHPCGDDRTYAYREGPVDLVMKVETHNHPTAISPFPGAATGSGGEIRDEAATGRGARSKAGLCGFSVSNLRIPDFVAPWETDHGRPARIASALDIMLEGPVGACAFNNEFGRPALAGYFRTFEAEIDGPHGREVRGYHKPIMIAGGLGNIRRELTHKCDLGPDTHIVILGGPAMLIGLGGGAASSVTSGSADADLDFASVQRENPEMERRCQEVIDWCWQQGDSNPIRSIHDVGAGGLSNAIPEIIESAGRGGHFDLRAIPSADRGLSPLEIWCNEAQERYVLAIATPDLDRFRAACLRERCPYAVVGQTTDEPHLHVADAELGETPIDVPLSLILGHPPTMERAATRVPSPGRPFATGEIDLGDAVRRVLRLPCVADKTFLVTIGDRTVTGMVCRDQMVGPWQVPVADCAVTASGYQAYTGEAFAIGERAPLALLDAPAAGRMAVGEAVTNIAAARIGALGNIALSANWMAACGHPGEDARLFDTVRAVGLELCPELGIPIPVGKDSLSMKTVWRDAGEERAVTSPLSLIVTAFAPVEDVRGSLTPELATGVDDTILVLIDLGAGRNRLGASALAQVYGQLGAVPPDLDSPRALRAFVAGIQALSADGRLLAYHDRSDGGLLVTACEMAFAAHAGFDLDLDALGDDPIAALFCEELGALVQVRESDLPALHAAFADAALAGCVHRVGVPRRDGAIRIHHGGAVLLEEPRGELHGLWSQTSFRMQALRDDPQCAAEAFARIVDEAEGGLYAALSFDPGEDICAPYAAGARPRVAILREQGVNGHVEMAAAFDRAGFEAVDVHMTDLRDAGTDLAAFHGLAACGGFSFGDVLGAGGGWAASIAHDRGTREAFGRFFERADTFALGVCNGAQMLSRLRPARAGVEAWPRFLRNRSEQFEARLVLTEVLASPSIFFADMAGSVLPTVVAHGEGRVAFDRPEDAAEAADRSLVCLRYVEPSGAPARRYPANPNGSPDGITGLTTDDGRITILMPHPERLFRTVTHSWHPHEWGEDAPWLRIFRNARRWLG